MLCEFKIDAKRVSQCVKILLNNLDEIIWQRILLARAFTLFIFFCVRFRNNFSHIYYNNPSRYFTNSFHTINFILAMIRKSKRYLYESLVINVYVVCGWPQIKTNRFLIYDDHKLYSNWSYLNTSASTDHRGKKALKNILCQLAGIKLLFNLLSATFL